MEYRIDVVRVIDADTISARVTVEAVIHLPGNDFQVYQSVVHGVRFDGVSAPEMRTPEGKLAFSWTVWWFESNPGPYQLITGTRETEKYGRYLGRVRSATTGRTINDDILLAGQAKPYQVPRGIR